MPNSGQIKTRDICQHHSVNVGYEPRKIAGVNTEKYGAFTDKHGSNTEVAGVNPERTAIARHFNGFLPAYS